MSGIGDEVAAVLRDEQLDEIEQAGMLEQRKPGTGKGVRKQASALRRYLKRSAARGVDVAAAELPAVNMNTMIGLRYKAIASAIIMDMGGVDRCSEVVLQLIRRFSGASALAEQLEVKAVAGEAVSIEQHALLSSTLARMARLIGTQRVPKELPSLEQYLTDIARRNANATPLDDDDPDEHDAGT
jgi:hypothetical protein